MPSRLTPPSWGPKLTPAQRQAARRQRLKAERANHTLNSETGKAQKRYQSLDEYRLSRIPGLKKMWPLSSDQEIRELALSMPLGDIKIGPDYDHEEAVRRHQKFNEEMAAMKAEQDARLAAYEAEQKRLEPIREARRRAEREEWERRCGHHGLRYRRS